MRLTKVQRIIKVIENSTIEDLKLYKKAIKNAVKNRRKELDDLN